MTFAHTGDLFGFEEQLSGEEREIVLRAEFPFHVVDGFRALDTAGLMYDGMAALAAPACSPGSSRWRSAASTRP